MTSQELAHIKNLLIGNNEANYLLAFHLLKTLDYAKYRETLKPYIRWDKKKMIACFEFGLNDIFADEIYLDWSGYGLTTLPESVKKLSKLQYLLLGGNWQLPFARVLDMLAALPEIIEINLKTTNTTFPGYIEQFSESFDFFQT